MFDVDEALTGERAFWYEGCEDVGWPLWILPLPCGPTEFMLLSISVSGNALGSCRLAEQSTNWTDGVDDRCAIEEEEEVDL